MRLIVSTNITLVINYVFKVFKWQDLSANCRRRTKMLYWFYYNIITEAVVDTSGSLQVVGEWNETEYDSPLFISISRLLDRVVRSIPVFISQRVGRAGIVLDQ